MAQLATGFTHQGKVVLALRVVGNLRQRIWHSPSPKKEDPPYKPSGTQKGQTDSAGGSS
jgi:hypothetical protein